MKNAGLGESQTEITLAGRNINNLRCAGDTTLIPILVSGLPWWCSSKGSLAMPRDSGSIPGCRRPPGERHGNPLQYSYLENPMHRGELGGP